MSLGVFELYCLYLAEIVEVSGVLVVRNLFGEGGLDNEVSGMLVLVLVQVASQDDVHNCSLTNFVVSQASSFIGVKHQRSHFWEFVDLLVDYSNEEH